MGILTQILPAGRNRFVIVFDDESRAVLNAPTLEAIDAQVGQQWEKSQWNAAVEQAQSQKCFDAAARLLQTCDRSRNGLARKLTEKGYCEQVVETTLNKMESFGYLDDERYAKKLAQEAILGSRPAGKRMAAHKLRQKGIDEDVAREALAIADDDTEREGALLWARKLIVSQPAISREKLAQRLRNKGFDYGAIRSALRAIESEREEAGESDEFDE